MGINFVKLGIILKKERKLRKISQQDLSRLVEVDQATISRVERGNEKITLQVYQKIALSLGIKINEEDAQELDQVFNDLYVLVQEHKRDAAKDLYETVLNKEAILHNEIPILKLIVAYYHYLSGKKSELDEAIIQLKNVSDQFSGIYVMYYHEILGAYHLLYTEEYPLAIVDLEKAFYYMVDHNIEDAFVYYLYGWVSFLVGNHTTSIVVINEARHLYKKSGNTYRLTAIYTLFGAVQLNDGNYHDAHNILTTCKQYKPYYNANDFNYILINSLLGLTELYLKNTDKAIRILEEVYHISGVHQQRMLFFLLIALKIAKDEEKINYYLNQISNDHEFKSFSKLLTNNDRFLNFEGKYLKDIESLINKHNLSNLTYFIMKEAIEDIYNLRQYSIYKNIFDIYIKFRLGDHHVSD